MTVLQHVHPLVHGPLSLWDGLGLLFFLWMLPGCPGVRRRR